MPTQSILRTSCESGWSDVDPERARRGQGRGKEGARKGQGGGKEGARRGQGGGKEGARRGQGGGKEGEKEGARKGLYRITTQIGLEKWRISKIV